MFLNFPTVESLLLYWISKDDIYVSQRHLLFWQLVNHNNTFIIQIKKCVKWTWMAENTWEEKSDQSMWRYEELKNMVNSYFQLMFLSQFGMFPVKVTSYACLWYTGTMTILSLHWQPKWRKSKYGCIIA